MTDNQGQNQGADVSGLFKKLGQKEKPAMPVFQESYQPSKIIQWLMKLSRGRIKTEKQATYVLLGLVAVVIIISLYLFFSGSAASSPAPGKITPR